MIRAAITMGRWAPAFLLAAFLAGGAGCGKKTTTQATGGTGVGPQPTQGASAELAAPGNVSVKKGGKADVTVKVTRDNYDEPIDLTFDLPKGAGLSIEEKTTRLDKGADKATFKIVAAGDAKVQSNLEATVTAKTPKLTPETQTQKFKIDVTE